MEFLDANNIRSAWLDNVAWGPDHWIMMGEPTLYAVMEKNYYDIATTDGMKAEQAILRSKMGNNKP